MSNIFKLSRLRNARVDPLSLEFSQSKQLNLNWGPQEDSEEQKSKGI